MTFLEKLFGCKETQKEELPKVATNPDDLLRKVTFEVNYLDSDGCMSEASHSVSNLTKSDASDIVESLINDNRYTFYDKDGDCTNHYEFTVPAGHSLLAKTIYTEIQEDQ